jgi:hypothetical protein
MRILNKFEWRHKPNRMYWERLPSQIIKFFHGDESFCAPWGDCFAGGMTNFFIVLNFCLAQHANNLIDYIRLEFVGWCPLEG